MRRHPFLAGKLLDVYQFDVRKPDLPVAFCQFCKSVFSLFGIVIGFDAWCGGSQQCLGGEHGRQHDSGIAGMIAGSRILLLVGRFVLFVNDYQSQPLEGQEYGRAHSQNHLVRSVGQLLLPYFHSFRVRELGMINSQAAAEHSSQPFGDLGGQCDFREQIEHLFPCLKSLLYQVDIDFCLSAGCYSMEQAHILLPERAENGVKRCLLDRAESIYRTCFFRLQIKSSGFMFVCFKDSFGCQFVQNAG